MHHTLHYVQYQHHSNQQSDNLINANKPATTTTTNSPLDFLQRLALLPECQAVVDPKSVVNENGNLINNDQTNATNNTTTTMPNANVNDLGDMNNNFVLKSNTNGANKRNLNDMNDSFILSSSPSSTSNSNNVANKKVRITLKF